MRSICSLLLLWLFAAIAPRDVSTQILPSGFTLEPVVPLAGEPVVPLAGEPVAFAFLPDGRILIVSVDVG